jgi:hypothetical protein
MFLPNGFDPGQYIGAALVKINNLPDPFWADLDKAIRGILDGDPEAWEAAKKKLGVVVNAN